MKQDLMKYLPPEIITNILSRLDVRSIAFNKCVSKPWLDLLSTDEFVKFHLSRSAAALAVVSMEGNSGRFAVFELEDEIDAEGGHDYLTKFDFPAGVEFEGSANGLILLSEFNTLYVCNPIRREYIQLDFPQGFYAGRRHVGLGSLYGFGASKISGQHKVFCIKAESESDCLYSPVTSDCIVYTLGTGSWRRVEPPSASFSCRFYSPGAFVNGNLHWLVFDSNESLLSCCFDLETECFSTFALPPVKVSLGCRECLSVLRDCLCVCDHTSENEIALWLMKDYGDDKSWTKEYVINLSPVFGNNDYRFVYPIKVFKDGDVLMLLNVFVFYYYSNKTKSIRKIGLFDAGDAYVTSMLLTPSFLSLKSFPMENVISL